MFRLDHYQLGDRLNDITLNIDSLEKVALLGPSGSGKTSLLNVLHQQCAEQIAWCPQDHGLVEALSGYHNIYMGQLEQHSALYNLANLIKPLARPKQAIIELCLSLGLDPQQQLWKSVNHLSGGQRQRIAIGRGLFRQQTCFLGDEPVSNLDPVQAQQILELIISRHKTVVIALHNRQQALSNFKRIIGIKLGRIVFDLPVEELMNNEYQVGLLDSLYE
jgi:phosphonate transport system ATP-binding protein